MPKEKIILLPGYDGDGEGTFNKLVKLIQHDYECIVVNYPYYHQTERSYSLFELNNYLHTVMANRHNARFHLLGFSMGGFVATSYALTYPQDLLSLTLVSSSVKPQLGNVYKSLLLLAYHSFKVPFVAKLFSLLYTSKLFRPLMKLSPLPLPRNNFPSSEGYPVFGSLANIMFQSINSNNDKAIKQLNFPKQAILFKDDLSFPADTYTKILTNLGFGVIVKENGGHATGTDYWNKVAEGLYR